MTRLIYYLTSLVLLTQISLTIGASCNLDISYAQNNSQKRQKSEFAVSYLIISERLDTRDSLLSDIEVEVIQKATCFGLNDGIIKVNLKGRDERGYTFQWDDLPPTSTSIKKNLTPGLHVLNVIDPLGNSFRDTIYLGMKYKIDASIEVISDAYSGTMNNGAAVVRLYTNQRGSYTYTWDTHPRQFSSVARNLAPGMYTVKIKDPRGCEAMEAVSIVDRSRESINTPEQHNPSYTLDTDVLNASEGPSLEVAPNPSTNGNFSIISPQRLYDCDMTIYDMNGKVVTIQRRIEGFSHRVILNELPSGVYHLQLNNGNGRVFNKQIVIQK